MFRASIGSLDLEENDLVDDSKVLCSTNSWTGGEGPHSKIRGGGGSEGPHSKVGGLLGGGQDRQDTPLEAALLAVVEGALGAPLQMGLRGCSQRGQVHGVLW